MSNKLIAPRLGEGVEELFIVNWLKKEGESVDEMESIVEVETDKVATEIPSPSSGTVIKILIPEGNPAKVGDVLAIIGNVGEMTFDNEIEAADNSDLPLQLTEPVDTANTKKDDEQRLPTKKDEFISPLVKKIAYEENIDLSKVIGSGLNGRITKKDLIDYLAEKKSSKATENPKILNLSNDKDSTQGQLILHSNSRRQIAERMVLSLDTSPHVLTVMEADLTRVLAHRTKLKPEFLEKGVNLTLTAYFISCIVKGLENFPKVNSTWKEDGLFLHGSINIGMAVALGENGLIVPVIKNADRLNLYGIASEVNDLSNRARSKKLNADEVKGATFTLTNHGSGGSLFASPIINQPQAGILGTGMMQKRPVVITDGQNNDYIAIRPMIYLSFVFDHRILDGEGADNFLASVKDNLENWQ